MLIVVSRSIVYYRWVRARQICWENGGPNGELQNQTGLDVRLVALLLVLLRQAREREISISRMSLSSVIAVVFNCEL